MKTKLLQIVFTISLLQLLFYFSNATAQWESEIVAEGGTANGWAVADFDRDGDPDLTYGNLQSGVLSWYENLVGDWDSRFITYLYEEGLTYSAQFAYDLDLDGDQDLIYFRAVEPTKLMWYENFENGLYFVEHIISDSLGRVSNLISNIADLDGDGDLDVVAGDTGYGKILWFENMGDHLKWSKHEVAAFAPTFSACVTSFDIDNDNDLDIVACRNNKVVYYENQLPEPAWPETVIETSLSSTNFCKGADMDGDGDLDVVSYSPNEYVIVWYENPTWDRKLITDDISQPILGAIGDLDGDSGLDVLLGGYFQIGWLENSGDGHTWQINIIETDSNRVFLPLGLAEAGESGLGDFNQDGFIDVATATWDLTANRADLRWYANPGITNVENEDHALPGEFELLQNYPNPFNPGTTISYAIPQSDFVELKIYNMLGREIMRAVSQYQQTGSYKVRFDASGLSNGVYYYQWCLLLSTEGGESEY